MIQKLNEIKLEDNRQKQQKLYEITSARQQGNRLQQQSFMLDHSITCNVNDVNSDLNTNGNANENSNDCYKCAMIEKFLQYEKNTKIYFALTGQDPAIIVLYLCKIYSFCITATKWAPRLPNDVDSQLRIVFDLCIPDCFKNLRNIIYLLKTELLCQDYSVDNYNNTHGQARGRYGYRGRGFPRGRGYRGRGSHNHGNYRNPLGYGQNLSI